jgi:3-oxoacyl-[acyl-carrier protein] reductase
MTNDLQGRIALVTGATRGIGRAAALELGARGAAVAINYREDKDGAQSVHDELEAQGVRSHLVRADVGVQADVEEMFKGVESALGPIDVLIAKAGTTQDRVLGLMRDDDWTTVRSVNLDSLFYCARRAIRPMMRKGWGRIITVASVAGLHGNVGQSNYCAAKAGAIGFSRALSREVAGKNITVNVVAPGYIDTVLFNKVPEQARAAALTQIPVGRFGASEEVGSVIGFLASPRASYVTGSVIVVDGGLSA